MDRINNNNSHFNFNYVEDISDVDNLSGISDDERNIIESNLRYENSSELNPQIMHFFYQSALAHKLDALRITMAHPDFHKMPNVYLEKAFLNFCSTGLLDGIELLEEKDILSSKLSLNVLDKGLDLACEQNHIPVVKAILEVDRDVDLSESFVTATSNQYGTLTKLLIDDDRFESISLDTLNEGWVQISMLNLVQAFTKLKNSPSYEDVDKSFKSIGFKEACRYGHQQIVKKYIPIYQDIQMEDRVTGFKYAILHQQRDTIDLFFKHDLIASFTPDDLGSCMRQASKMGDDKTIERFISSNRSEDIPLKDIQKSFTYSCTYGHKKVWNLLYRHYKDKIGVSDWNKGFIKAAKKNNSSIIRAFLASDRYDELHATYIRQAIHILTYLGSTDGLRAIINSRLLTHPKNNLRLSYFTDGLGGPEENIVTLIDLVMNSQNSQEGKVFHLSSILIAIAPLNYPTALKKITRNPLFPHMAHSLFKKVAPHTKAEALTKMAINEYNESFYIVWDVTDKKELGSRDITQIAQTVMSQNNWTIFDTLIPYFDADVVNDLLVHAVILGSITAVEKIFVADKLKLLSEEQFSNRYWQAIQHYQPVIAYFFILQTDRINDISIFNLEQTLYAAAEAPTENFADLVGEILNSDRRHDLSRDSIERAKERAEQLGNRYLADILAQHLHIAAPAC